MEQQDSVQSGAKPGADVGAMLREARERMGMSVDEVAGRLKFAPRQVAALEAGDFGQLPELAFVRGFVRSYARLVLLDEKALLDALPGAPAPAAIQVRASRNEVPHQGAERLRQNLFWLGAAVVVVVVGILAWKYDAGETRTGGTQLALPASTEGAPEAQTGAGPQNAPVASAAGVQPSVQPGQTAEAPATGVAAQPEETAAAAAPAGEGAPAAEAPLATHAAPAVSAEKGAAVHNGEKRPAHAAAHGAASGASGVAAATTMAHAKPRHVQQAASGVSATGTGAPQALGPSRTVHLEFTEDSWVEVRDGTGKILLSMLGKQGTSRNAAGPTPLLVVVGNAKGVKLSYKGQPVALQPIAGSGVARLKLE